MSPSVSLTIDVEDWYEGMAVLGHEVEAPTDCAEGLQDVAAIAAGTSARFTLFVVGRHAARFARPLGELGAGHEVASHGLDHGRLPRGERDLVAWLRAGREAVEDVVGRKVGGFRSPRFDLPDGMTLDRYRGCLSEAGFAYVSDDHSLGASSPIAELPVFRWHRLPLGGGSYHRLLPVRPLVRALSASSRPVVLYFHSYDFGRELPRVRDARSLATLSQVAGRNRIRPVFLRLLDELGSVTCAEALDGV